jgi:transcriptional regulator with XRE-family HTH domain
MPIEIGERIKIELKNQGLNHKEFGELINRHEKTVPNILKRKTIDTQLLTIISNALKHDFFKYFYEEQPLKAFKEEEMSQLNNEIANLKKEIEHKDEYIATNKKYIQSQEDVIRLLKEKEQFLNI